MGTYGNRITDTSSVHVRSFYPNLLCGLGAQVLSGVLGWTELHILYIYLLADLYLLYSIWKWILGFMGFLIFLFLEFFLIFPSWIMLLDDCLFSPSPFPRSTT